ncbi:hypothetical protein [Paenibacillus macerans]|uniref:hypothetical protein n=1 Tax=Paenibacillus macerans TaxID=44252 RepID=UPI0020417B49|nr:hypothetical protein [Paenibacillus macerans]MCM3701865.1 hypothetical protein [Paenibacillus macerans]
MNLTSDERIMVVIALEAMVAQFAGQVHTFKGKKKYAKEYASSKADLEKTVDLIKKFEEVPF